MQNPSTDSLSSTTPHPSTERGAYIIELKRRYAEGTLASTVRPDMVSATLIEAVFSGPSPTPPVIH